MNNQSFPEISFSDALKSLENAAIGINDPIGDVIVNLGSNLPSYFSNNYSGGLELQQVPGELEQLSKFLIKKFSNGKPVNYLEIGAGSCGTIIFFSELFLQNQVQASFTAIDNLDYYRRGILVNQKERIEWCVSNLNLTFAELDSSKISFSDWLSDKEFDVIFIDGDHSYGGCLWDFILCNQSLNPGGVLIFHDITSEACPGVGEVFRLASEFFAKTHVFSYSNTCGIGVLENFTGCKTIC